MTRTAHPRISEGLEDACWEGYEAVGMKEKDGKQVPNCVPTKTAGLMTPHGWAPSTTPGDVTRWESVEVESKNGGRTFDVVAYGRTAETNREVRSVLAFGYKDADQARTEADTYRVKMRIRTAASSEYPSVVREVEDDYKRKAITRGERDELLSAISGASSKQEAERIVSEHRKGRAASVRVAARYSGDPYWLTAKYPGVDNKGRPFKKGERVFYYPRTKTILTGEDAERAAAEFEAAAFDEDFGYRGASSSRVAYDPPFHNAAKADEALGEAYRALIDLKLGFDSWNEIPSSAHPLYQQIMKAVDAIVTARQSTTQVRAMVARKRY